MIQLSFDAAIVALLLFVAGYALLLHHRMGRLRRALAEAGQILPALDAAVARMTDTAGSFSGRVQTEMQAVDGRIAGVKRLAGELAQSSRTAEEMLAKLDQQLRQARRVETARSAAVPRERVEPKGFAERMSLMSKADRGPAPAPTLAPTLAAAGERIVRVNMLSA